MTGSQVRVLFAAPALLRQSVRYLSDRCSTDTPDNLPARVVLERLISWKLRRRACTSRRYSRTLSSPKRRDRLGSLWQYHPGSGHHSKVARWGVIYVSATTSLLRRLRLILTWGSLADRWLHGIRLVVGGLGRVSQASFSCEFRIRPWLQPFSPRPCEAAGSPRGRSIRSRVQLFSPVPRADAGPASRGMKTSRAAR